MRARILVVDDDPSQRLVLSRYLSRTGAQVIVAARATEALARLETESVDLLVTDLDMPGESGLWLVERAKGHRSDLPVVLVTGAGRTRLDAEEAGSPPDAILYKPFLMESLGKVCSRLLERRESGSPG